MIRLRAKTSPRAFDAAEKRKKVEALRELSERFEARSAQKLLQVARRQGVAATLENARQAVAPDVGRQLFAPKPRSLGKSAAEGPGERLQADLIDLSNNAGASRGAHRYALVVSDVWSRKAWTEALRYKDGSSVNRAMQRVMAEVPGHGQNAVLTTDQGNEWKGIGDYALPQGTVHREKEVQDRNAIAVVDRTIQTLKKDLAAKVARTGQGWATQLAGATEAYNERPHAAVHGEPADAEKPGVQRFFIDQDNADKFLHNRGLTIRRRAALKDAGAFRAPVYGESRSFRPAYENAPQVLGGITPGAGYAKNTTGKETLLKYALPVPRGSARPLAQLTAPRRQKQPRGPREAAPPPPAPAPELPAAREGGSSGSGGANPASPRGGISQIPPKSKRDAEYYKALRAAHGSRPPA